MAPCALLVKETGTIDVQRIEGVAQIHNCMITPFSLSFIELFLPNFVCFQKHFQVPCEFVIQAIYVNLCAENVTIN